MQIDLYNWKKAKYVTLRFGCTSFMGCDELDCPTCVIVASFVDHGYETNIYHLLQCWNGFWDLLWLENGNQDSVLKRSVLWEDQLLHIL